MNDEEFGKKLIEHCRRYMETRDRLPVTVGRYLETLESDVAKQKKILKQFGLGMEEVAWDDFSSAILWFLHRMDVMREEWE